MFLAIDRVSKFTYVEFHDPAGKMEGAAFLRSVVEVFGIIMKRQREIDARTASGRALV